MLYNLKILNWTTVHVLRGRHSIAELAVQWNIFRKAIESDVGHLEL